MSDDDANSERSDLPKVMIDWETLGNNTYRMTIENIELSEWKQFLDRIMKPQLNQTAFPDRNITLISPIAGHSPSSDMLLTELKQRLQGKDFRTP